MPEQRTVTFFRPSASCQVPDLGFLYELTFGRSTTGLVVEVGAFDGESFSNSSCLIARGWRAVLVEPVPEFAEKCRTQYASSPQVAVVESACGSRTGTLSMVKAGALSSASTAQIDEYRSIDWAQRSLSGATSSTVLYKDSINTVFVLRPGPGDRQASRGGA